MKTADKVTAEAFKRGGHIYVRLGATSRLLTPVAARALCAQLMGLGLGPEDWTQLHDEAEAEGAANRRLREAFEGAVWGFRQSCEDCRENESELKAIRDSQKKSTKPLCVRCGINPQEYPLAICGRCEHQDMIAALAEGSEGSGG